MRYAAIHGLSSRCSRIVLGTDSLADAETAFAILDAALALGINTLDTARAYGSEETIGRWMMSRRRRSDVVIVTKGGFPHAPTGERIRLDCQASLAALQTDHIDCYLVHYDDTAIDLDEMLSALERLRQEGKIRTFGLSNFRFERVQKVVQFCSHHGFPGPSVISANDGLMPWVSPLWPNAETLAGREKRTARAWYEAQGHAIFAYSPLGRGFFKAKAAGRAVGPHYDCAVNHERYRRASELAEAKGVSPAQIALAFLLSRSARSFAVVGSRDPAHLRLDAAAADISLSADECAWLESYDVRPGAEARQQART